MTVVYQANDCSLKQDQRNLSGPLYKQLIHDMDHCIAKEKRTYIQNHFSNNKNTFQNKLIKSWPKTSVVIYPYYQLL